MVDERLYSPSSERNREPIAEVLRRVLPPAGTVLEIGSGSGEHAVYFAQRFPQLTWQPSDPEARHRYSIEAWRACSGPPNVRPPLELDALCDPWPVEQADAVLAINVIHIAPWAVCLAILRGAAEVLSEEGLLYLYGAYREGADTAPSNELFDDWLRQQNPEWGVRELAAVAQAASECGMMMVERVEMPSHNLSLIFRRQGRAANGEK